MIADNIISINYVSVEPNAILGLSYIHIKVSVLLITKTKMKKKKKKRENERNLWRSFFSHEKNMSLFYYIYTIISILSLFKIRSLDMGNYYIHNILYIYIYIHACISSYFSAIFKTMQTK